MKTLHNITRSAFTTWRFNFIIYVVKMQRNGDPGPEFLGAKMSRECKKNPK